MPPRIRDNGDSMREFSSAEKMFVCNLKIAGEKYPNICKLFTEKFGKSPPNRQGANKMVQKLRNKFTVHDLRKGRSGRKFTVRTPANIASVRRSLERAATRAPGVPGPSARRHDQDIKKSSFNNITKKDLKLKPYKILRLHQVTNQQTTARLKMGRLLARKPNSWFENLCVSDEAWFTLSGHVFNRQNTVCYSPAGEGVPDQWVSQATQSQEKVMVFCLLHGSGHKFGPFFLEQEGRINQFSYRELLEELVFPAMRQGLGRSRFKKVIWQQDGAKPHQARMVMEWLDSIFGDQMLAIKSIRGDMWAPYSPDMNPCDFFLWGFLKEKVYQPLPKNMTALKRKIKTELDKIPEFMVKKAILAMRKRANLMVEVGGAQFEGRKL